MSIQHVGAVLHEMPELGDRVAAFVLMVIADSAHQKSGVTFNFTMMELAAAARCSRRAAIDRVRYLEREGYIETMRRGEPGAERQCFRLLYGFDGKRKTAAELYPQPHAHGAPPRAHGAPPHAHGARPPPSGTIPATKDRARARAPVRLSPSLSKEGLQQIGIRKKKIPAEESASERRDRLEAEKQRQRRELSARMTRETAAEPAP